MTSNVMSIDVEDYYMVSAFADVVRFEDWGTYDSRVEKNTYRILELLNEYSVKATFFILGWVGEHYPNLVRDIHTAGHEVASHGYNHRLVYELSPAEFREDVRKSKRILEDISGNSVTGYRAASYSVVRETFWALDILIEEGFVYDSSIFPVYHDRYGVPDADRFPHIINRGDRTLWEFPPSTYRLLGTNVPISGGGYFRLFPFWICKFAISRINSKEDKPVIFYLHPWEIDGEQPRLSGRTLSKIRHYTNLSSTYSKLSTLLKEFQFQPISSFLSGHHSLNGNHN